MRKKITIEIDLTIPPEYEGEMADDKYVCEDIKNLLYMGLADSDCECSITTKCEDLDERY